MSELKVTDRRWWARSGEASDASPGDEAKLKPTYVEELEARLAAKDAELRELLTKFRGASEEFDQARARLRKEVTKDVERGRRSLIVSFLEVLDNLDRALSAAGDRADDPFVRGVSIVRQQFLTTLEGLGVQRVDPSAARSTRPGMKPWPQWPRPTARPPAPSSASSGPVTSSARTC